jgi:hypothetical protein
MGKSMSFHYIQNLFNLPASLEVGCFDALFFLFSFEPDLKKERVFSVDRIKAPASYTAA